MGQVERKRTRFIARAPHGIRSWPGQPPNGFICVSRYGHFAVLKESKRRTEAKSGLRRCTIKIVISLNYKASS